MSKKTKLFESLKVSDVEPTYVRASVGSLDNNKIFGSDVGRGKKIPRLRYSNSDGAMIIDTFVGRSMNSLSMATETAFTKLRGYINNYRYLEKNSDVDFAIGELTSEITGASTKEKVKVILDEVDISDNIKKKIEEEFEKIISMMRFNKTNVEKIRRWLVDGRAHYLPIYDDNKSNKNGIVAIRELDSRNLLKVKLRSSDDISSFGIASQLNDIQEYNFYIYFDGGVDCSETFDSSMMSHYADKYGLIIIPIDGVVSTYSTTLTDEHGIVLSDLEKALKYANNLSSLDDALVIDRIIRAPQRLAFYYDVEGLTPKKAEAAIKAAMKAHRTQFDYNPENGEVVSENKLMGMLDDYWIPRRNGKGTEIQSIDSASNKQNNIEDIEYIERKFKRSLGVPFSRFETESSPFSSRVADISRDERKFNKRAIEKRQMYSEVFLQFLKLQILAKSIMTIKEWNNIKDVIDFKWMGDLFYEKQEGMELLQQKIEILQSATELEGKYFTREYLLKTVMGYGEDEIKEFHAKRKKEQVLYKDEKEDDNF